MIKKVCDKCGSVIPNNHGTAKIPTYRIIKYPQVSLYSKEINLCDSCEKLFDKWITERQDEEM